KYRSAIHFCLDKMMTAGHVRELASSTGPPLRSGIKSALVKQLATRATRLTMDTLHDFCLRHWTPPRVDIHKANLTSGRLEGHSWGGARPSNLHLSIQDRARRVSRGEIDLQEFLRGGDNILKHEYYMVAVADLCEHLIISRFEATPSIIARGVVDFILRGVPYDLKNTAVPGGWTFRAIRRDPRGFADSMWREADTERLREQAKSSVNEWAYNRLYIVLEKEGQWLADPDVALAAVERAVARTSHPITIRVGRARVKVLVVTVPG
ncbi:MAG TPA: hypothetical protein VFK78_01980, partial [Gemmatimonadales bacterium]|nr:hypothetical protein [Gemmatimonadales bacterium]